MPSAVAHALGVQVEQSTLSPSGAESGRSRHAQARGSSGWVAGGATDGPSLERSWEAWQIRKALDELPVDERAVVRLAYVEGLTHSETADRLGIPIGTVKSRTYRAHRRLSELLAHLAPYNNERGGERLDGQ